MSTHKTIHGSGTGPVNDEDKDTDKPEEPKFGPDPVIAIAEFFERRERHRKPRVLTSFSRRNKK